MGGEVKIPLPTHAQVQEILDIVERLPQTLVEGELSDDWVTLFEPTTKTELVEAYAYNVNTEESVDVNIAILGETSSDYERMVGALWDASDDAPELSQIGDYEGAFIPIVNKNLDADEVFVQPTRMVLEPGQSILGRASLDGMIYARILGMEVI